MQPTPTADPGRYRLSLTIDDRTVMAGWWASEETARKKWAAAVGDYGRPGARITLVDTETSEQLAAWPAPVVGGQP